MSTILDRVIKFPSIFSSVREIGEYAFSALFPSGLRGYPFFLTLEETLTGQFKFYYLVLRDGNQTILIAPCFVMDYPLNMTAQGFLKKWTNFLNPRVVICGSPVGEGVTGIAPGQKNDLALKIVEGMRQIAQIERASTLAFKDFLDEWRDFFKPLASQGFHKISSYPSVELEIAFHSFEEYLTSLGSATRKDLRRKFRSIEKLPPLRMEVVSEPGIFLDQIYRLYLAAFAKSEVQFEKVTQDFFEKISSHMPDQTHYFLWFLDEKLVAFDLCLVEDDLLMDEYVGFDEAVNQNYHLYFVTFRDILLWCLAHGIRRYRSGALNYEPKKRLDFKFIPLNIYVRHKQPFWNLLLALASHVLKPENSDPVLKSMKKRRSYGKKPIPANA